MDKLVFEVTREEVNGWLQHQLTDAEWDEMKFELTNAFEHVVEVDSGLIFADLESRS